MKVWDSFTKTLSWVDPGAFAFIAVGIAFQAR